MGKPDARTSCPYCGTPVPINNAQCVADGRAGLLHVDCYWALRKVGWGYGKPISPHIPKNTK